MVEFQTQTRVKWMKSVWQLYKMKDASRLDLVQSLFMVFWLAPKLDEKMTPDEFVEYYRP